MLLLLRTLVGFSIGGLPVAFTLFTEYCPTSGRGAWLVVLQVVPSPVLNCREAAACRCKTQNAGCRVRSPVKSGSTDLCRSPYVTQVSSNVCR